MKELIIEASTGNLNKVLEFIDAELEAAGCGMKAQMQIDIAVEELFVNIASYAYGHDKGKAEIRIKIEGVPPAAHVELRDFGMPFNPLDKQDPDVTLSAAERKIGGLGIFMVKKSMDDFTYRYENGQNILNIIKAI